LSFLTHEYFHHYNVKRIRPIELGPFDYDKGNRTNQLWISEGLSVYYEYLILKRAGLISQEQLLNLLRANIEAFQNKPGRLFQSLAQASFETWSDGPFGRTGDEINKTISYYDKGPIVGMLLDFAIRHETKNRKSLDDVMRKLYQDYYIKEGRGFTEDEFWNVCKLIAGKALPEIHDYVYTTNELDYMKYMTYAGLSVDTAKHEMPGSYAGFSLHQRKDTFLIRSVDWESPATRALLHINDIVSTIDDLPVSVSVLNEKLNAKQPGDKLKVVIYRNGIRHEKEIALVKKFERHFVMQPLTKPDSLQTSILQSW